MTEPHDNEMEWIADLIDEKLVGWTDDESERTQAASEASRYQDRRFLASGGMKEIFEVRDTKMRRMVAMAQLKPDGPLWHCESFLHEAHIGASLVHPNIISVYDLGLTADNSPFFVMELKIGNTLRDLVEKGTDKEELLQIFLRVCDAVAYAHSEGVLHLDIKPDNVQVGEHGIVKLCDWGLACRISEAGVTRGFVRGTPGFMSPEQLQDGAVGYYTDIFSLGAMLCFMLTGQAPFEGGLDTIISDTVVGLPEIRVEQTSGLSMSGSLDAVVRRALSADPEDRYLSVNALKADVMKFLSGYSTSAEDAGLLKEALLFYKRNKTSSLIALTLVAMLGITVAFFVQSLRTKIMELELTSNNLRISREKEGEAHRKKELAYLESEKNYERYLGQKKAQTRTSNELRARKLEQAYAAVCYPVYFSDPVKSLEESLPIFVEEYRAGNEVALEQQIIVNLFLSQQFSEMEEYIPTFTSPLANLAEKYSGLERSVHGTLRRSDFLCLLDDLNEEFLGEHNDLGHSVFERLIFFDQAKRGETSVDLNVLQQLVRYMNPSWDPRKFKFHPSKKKLVIRGERLQSICANHKYSSQRCIFSLADLNDLVLSRTGIGCIEDLYGLNLNKLDISNTAISTLHPHLVFSGIAKLRVAVDQMPKHELENPPPNVRITFEKPPGSALDDAARQN